MADTIKNNPNSIVNSPFYAGYPPWHMDKRGNGPAMKAPGSASGVRMGNPNPQVVSYASASRTNNYYNTTNVYNNAASQGAARSQSAPPVAGPAKYVKYQPKEYDAYAKQKRKERDYFWVMRKGVCFLMFVIALLLVAVIALGIVGLPAVDQYTAMFVDTAASKNIPFGDPIYGMIGKFLGTDTSAYTYQANADAVANGVAAHPEDTMGMIANILVPYFPIAIVLLAVFALVTAILAFVGMFGKRIFKGFGAFAIVMLLMGLIVAVAGLAVLGAKSGAPYIHEETGLLVSILNFSQVVSFLTGIFVAAKEIYIVGTGLFALIAGSILLLLLSMFARRKVPYSVFDFSRPTLDPSLYNTSGSVRKY